MFLTKKMNTEITLLEERIAKHRKRNAPFKYHSLIGEYKLEDDVLSIPPVYSVEYHCDNIKEILREMRIIRQAEVTLKDLTSQMEMESIKNPDHNPEDDDNDWESDNDWHLMVAGERALYDGEEIIKCNKKNE
ncbi:hypothetical protein HCN44_007207 [Aphidius gifuensis]|uniref:Uncharacterized protein n=1 Tax=Aphidius gifuensis TaxID=684658 RepID=A0A834XNR1_APHGI|nr:hypothetical protein HCN44_007207 [Aphidius gifuensis]